MRQSPVAAASAAGGAIVADSPMFVALSLRGHNIEQWSDQCHDTSQYLH